MNPTSDILVTFKTSPSKANLLGHLLEWSTAKSYKNREAEDTFIRSEHSKLVRQIDDHIVVCTVFDNGTEKTDFGILFVNPHSPNNRGNVHSLAKAVIQTKTVTGIFNQPRPRIFKESPKLVSDSVRKVARIIIITFYCILLKNRYHRTICPIFSILLYMHLKNFLNFYYLMLLLAINNRNKFL